MYQVSDVVLINKIDAMEYFDFDLEKAKARILALNPRAVFFPISAKTGEGMDALCDWVLRAVEAVVEVLLVKAEPYEYVANIVCHNAISCC
jgi:Ni2+-binding GTPase involved in maturation of urease and hydrogenase